mgnify:CR=1 FL=1
MLPRCWVYEELELLSTYGSFKYSAYIVAYIKIYRRCSNVSRSNQCEKVVVEEIAGKFNDSQSAVVVEYRGLSVAEVTELRKSLREEDVEFKVYKNKLVQRATESAGYAEINDKLVGPNAIAFGHSDAVAPARILANFAKDHEALVIKAGIVEGKVLEVEEINEIAKLPGREGMYSMLLGMLQAPVSKFARVVKAVADAREENGGKHQLKHLLKKK